MRVGIVGASGYAGGELMRLLLDHPKFEVVYVAAGSNAGESITSVHSHLTSFTGKIFSPIDLVAINALELLFIALPHGESGRLVPQLRPDLPVVDLGADFRLSDDQAWERYYGGNRAGRWVYGLPEMPGRRAMIQNARRVANPGCYATAFALAMGPLATDLSAELTDITMVAASGTTGAGRGAKVNLLASEVMNSLVSYKFGGTHQHIPEMEQNLLEISARPTKVSFTPILAPLPRGILATVTLRYSGDFDAARAQFESAYQHEPFVQLLEAGQMPETSSVTGSNSAHLQVALDEHTSRLVVSVAIDNLGKGAAGQAIQNANLINGLTETAGLPRLGVGQ